MYKPELTYDNLILLHMYKEDNNDSYIKTLIEEHMCEKEDIENVYNSRIDDLFKSEGIYFNIDTDKFPIENIIPAIKKESFAHNLLDRTSIEDSIDEADYFIRTCYDKNYENVCVNEVNVVTSSGYEYVLTAENDKLNIPLSALNICFSDECPTNIMEMSTGYSTNNEVKEYHICDMEDYYRMESEMDDFISCMNEMDCYYFYDCGNGYMSIETQFGMDINCENLGCKIYVGDNLSETEFLSKLSEYYEEFEDRNPDFNSVLDAKDFFRGLSEKFDKVEYDDYTARALNIGYGMEKDL